jgi:hypothetical protein
MTNPFVDGLEQLSDQDILNKIDDLTKKYFMTNNNDVKNLITSQIDFFKMTLEDRQINKRKNSGDSSLDNLINVD